MRPFFKEPAAREEKPGFDAVPDDILRAIGRRLDGAVVSGEPVYGSFSASAGFVLTLDSGLKVFAKGTHPGEMAHGTQHLRQEIAAYENLPVLQDVAPAYYGYVWDNDEDGWMLGLWEYIARDPMAHAATGLSDMMTQVVKTHGSAAPAGILNPARAQNYMSQFFQDRKKWRRLQDEPAVRDRFLGLFADAAAGQAWLAASLDALVALQEKAAATIFAEGVIHGDLRLDNVLFGATRAYLVDWPNVCAGPVLFDLVFLAAHLESLGVGRAEDFVAAYQAAGGRPFSDTSAAAEELAAMLAGVSGFFADHAGRAVPDKLPRLRWMQKSLLLGQLRWLARIGKIESPPPLKGQQDA